MYLNGYVPALQTEGGFVHFVRHPLGYRIASTAVAAPLSDGFVQDLSSFPRTRGWIW